MDPPRATLPFRQTLPRPLCVLPCGLAGWLTKWALYCHLNELTTFLHQNRVRDGLSTARRCPQQAFQHFYPHLVLRAIHTHNDRLLRLVRPIVLSVNRPARPMSAVKAVTLSNRICGGRCRRLWRTARNFGSDLHMYCTVCMYIQYLQNDAIG
jgi:hypothetical protein